MGLPGLLGNPWLQPLPHSIGQCGDQCGKALRVEVVCKQSQIQQGFRNSHLSHWQRRPYTRAGGGKGGGKQSQVSAMVATPAVEQLNLGSFTLLGGPEGSVVHRATFGHDQP